MSTLATLDGAATPAGAWAARRPGEAGQALVDGELVLTLADLQAISAMVREDAGIVLDSTKATLVYSRLAKRLRALGLGDFSEYCALVASPGGAEERQAMLAALTTNVTRFFREPHHFEHLRSVVLPPLVERARRGGRVRLWSAACSNGQEPYSIALVLLSLLPEAARHDVRILATDIDPNMVAAGRDGLYPEGAVAAVPAELRRHWFRPAPEEPGSLRVDAALRELVAFRVLNLVGSWPMRGRFDAVFCRNVVIYFEEATQVRLWGRLARQMQPDGVLYIGHSERLGGEAASLFRSEGVTTYRLLAGGAEGGR